MLITVLGLLLAAVILVAGAPVALSLGSWRMRYPRVVLAAWHAAFLGGLACLGASLVLSVASSVNNAVDPAAGWFESIALVILGWSGLGAVGALGSLTLSRAEPLTAAERQTQVDVTLLAARSGNTLVHGVDVVVIDTVVPVALSVPGSRPRIIIASCLESLLSPVQLRAVIEHEKAHLVKHHGRVSQLAQLNQLCLPMLPAARELERTTRLLVELIADDAAARAVGAVNAANALLILGDLQGNESMLLRAQRLATRPPQGSLSTSRRVRRTLATLKTNA